MVVDARLGDGVMADAELIAAARTGDADAFGALYERHAGAAWVVARQYTDTRHDADDVVADAFAAVHGALLRGNGPESAFRAYLFTVVRRAATERREKARRVVPTDDVGTLEAGTALAGTADEPTLEGFERGVVARAFHSLPERWQAVLWHSEVEGLAPAQIAPILGLTANGVAALAYRAREGLRQAYLQQHLQDPLDESCRGTAAKLGSYVRGGLGTRENAQVEKHLEGCGDCRALVLELGDVNHGMRAVVAPLVLGIAGLGALAHLLPVGGGLAAGAAAAGSGAGGGAAGGAAAGTAAATGTTAAVGAGAGAGAAAAGGAAALFGAIPLGAVAVAAGAVVLGAVTVAGVTGLLKGDEPQAGPAPSVSASSESVAPTGTAEPTPTPTPTAPGPSPSAIPTPDADLDGTVLAGDDDAATLDDDTVDAGPDPVGEPTTDPEPQTVPPADVSVDIPDGGLVLAAGLTGQDLTIGVRNSGGTAATELVAEITLPTGVSVDGIAGVALESLPAGRFGVRAAGGWVCADAVDGVVRCTLDALPPASVARLVLRVSIDEAYDSAEAQVGLSVRGNGISYRPAPIPLRVHAAPARLALRSTPAPLTLVSGRPGRLDLDLANLGGTPVAGPPATATLHVPRGVQWALAPGSAAWSCRAVPQDRTVTCDIDRLGVREAAPLGLLLTAGEPTEIGERSLGLDLRPTGVRSPEHVALAFEVVRPARLDVSGDTTTTLARGRDVVTTLAVSNRGDLPANGLVAHLTRPAGTTWPTSPVPGWACGPTDQPRITCSRDQLPPGQTAAVAARVVPDVGAVGPLGELVVHVAAPDADGTPEHRVAVSATAPVLSVAPPTVLVSSGGAGTVSFGVSVAGGPTAADAEAVVATVALPAALRVDQDSVGSGVGDCVAVDVRHVRCAFDIVSAGSTAEAIVGVRWSGSARGTVQLDASAPGATTVSASAQVTTSSAGLSPRVHVDGGWAVTEVGAPLLTCPTTLTTCLPALQNGDRDNNSFDMVELDEAPDAPWANGTRPALPVSSAATLDVPAGRQIAFAGLYWSANAGPGDTFSGALDVARLRGPGTAYQTVRAAADDVHVVTDKEGRRYYQSFVDVTAQVAAEGGGRWSVADVAVRATRTDPNRSYYAGWSLVVVYADPGTDASVTVYDGAAWIGTGAQPPVFEFAAEPGTSARIGVVGWEGDRTAVGDRLLLDGQRALVPQRWDGSTPQSGTGNAFDSTAHGWRLPNSLGVDAKSFAPVNLGGSVSSLVATTSGDQYLVGVVTLRTDPVGRSAPR